jgi:hypothetical protein
MSDDAIDFGGASYLRLETVARIYDVEIVWLEECADAGLFGEPVPSVPPRYIAVARLDHVATIVRLRRVAGPDVEAIRQLLNESLA